MSPRELPASVTELARIGLFGSLPGETMPSWGVALAAPRPQALIDALRCGRPAVVARIEANTVVCDLRTVEPWRDGDLAAAIDQAGRLAG